MATRALHLKIINIIVASLLAAAPASAAQDARTFMDRVFSRTSWKDMHSNVRLTLTNKRGDTKKREIELWSKRNSKGESSILMRFESPADVRGTGFLLIEHEGADDDRRLFLPALRRVKRISASGSGGNFMSSDFTYYDIGRPELDDWTYSFGGDKEVRGTACRIVLGRARSAKVKEDTGYSKIVWCVDPKRKVVLGADYHDKSGRKHKVMRALKIEEISGSPFATHVRMQDAATGHRSDMIFSDVETDTGLPARLFTSRNLMRWTR